MGDTATGNLQPTPRARAWQYLARPSCARAHGKNRLAGSASYNNLWRLAARGVLAGNSAQAPAGAWRRPSKHEKCAGFDTTVGDVGRPEALAQPF